MFLRVPPELEHIVARPGREWTDRECDQLVEWLFRRELSQLLLFITTRLTRFNIHITASDAEDVWMTFVAHRLRGLMRRHDPAKGRFEPAVSAVLAQECSRAARRLQARLRMTTPLDAEGRAEWLRADGSNPEKLTFQNQVREAVQGCVARLAPEYRTVVAMRFFSGMDVKDIARAVGISEGLAKVRLHRAMQRLRKCDLLQRLCNPSAARRLFDYLG